MPLPILAAAGAAIAEFCIWIAGRFAIKKVWEVVASASVSGVMLVLKGELYDDAKKSLAAFFEEEIPEIRRRLNRVIYTVVLDDTGLELDQDDPFGSGSISRALSKKTGIPVRDILNKETTQEDLEAYALDRIAERSGFRITSLRNKDIIIRDMQRIAGQIIVQKTGIPISNFDSPEAIKADLLGWAEAQVAGRIAGNIAEAALIKNEFGVSVQEQIKALAGKDLSAKNLVEGAKNALLSASIKVNQNAQKGTMPDRRTLQNREAQRRFREKHGNRMKYISLRENPARIGPEPKPKPAVVLKKAARPIRRNALGIPIRGGG